jgi:hypothetical protein
MTKGRMANFHLPLIYGLEAKTKPAPPVPQEQVNRMGSMWFCEAQRILVDEDDRIETTKKTPMTSEHIYLSENRRLANLLQKKTSKLSHHLLKK